MTEPLKLKYNPDSTLLSEAIKEYQLPSMHDVDGVRVPASAVVLLDPTTNPVQVVSPFSWDGVIPSTPAEDTQTSAGAAVQMLYTVPPGRVWHIVSWRVTLSIAKVTQVSLFKEVARTNLIEQWLNIAAPTATIPYSSRGLNAANNYGWTELDLPPGATISFNYAADGAGQTMSSQLMYKERIV